MGPVEKQATGNLSGLVRRTVLGILENSGFQFLHKYIVHFTLEQDCTTSEQLGAPQRTIMSPRPQTAWAHWAPSRIAALP